MHAKYMLFDDRTVFLGSMNMDPRSLYLNTELGVMLESMDLVATLRRSFDAMTRPENAYVVVNTADGIVWQAGDEVLTSEPAHSLWQRVVFRLMQLLPLSNQL
jgi:putative cardiolipin synthase